MIKGKKSGRGIHAGEPLTEEVAILKNSRAPTSRAALRGDVILDVRQP